MIISNSPEETVAAGAERARQAQMGDVFALVGEVGTGKTQFAKGFVAGIGSPADVTSPTFTLLHEYEDGRLPVYHFDFYRLDSPVAVARLGFDEYTKGDGVCLIEWADRFPQLLPPGTMTITIRTEDEDRRVIEETSRR